MPNSFLGFPVPRAKIADMIAAAAPPSLHHAQHENGGTDEIDATGLTGAGGSGLTMKDFLSLSGIIESLDGYLVNTAGTGSVVIDNVGAFMSTGTTSSSNARFYRSIQDYLAFPNFGKDVVFSVLANFDSRTSKNGTFQIFLGESIDFAQIGFEVVDGILYGICAKTSAHTTVALETLGAVAFDTQRFLQAVFTAGSKVEFYVNGVLSGEITTNLPVLADTFTTLLSFQVYNLANAQQKIMIIEFWSIHFKLT